MKPYFPCMTENQMEKKMENEMETGVVWGFKELELRYSFMGIYQRFLNIVTYVKFLHSNPGKGTSRRSCPHGFVRLQVATS